jgi:hypothetical protein
MGEVLYRPHVRPEMCLKMVKVVKAAMAGGGYELTDFLKVVARFEKKFYRKNFHCDSNKLMWIMLDAVAVSRELTFRFSMPIEATNLIDAYVNDDPAKIPNWVLDTNGILTFAKHVAEEKPINEIPPETEFPEHGYVPARENDAKLYFPMLEAGNYVDVLRYNGFTRVDIIED